MTNPYQDILDCPRPPSAHARMKRQDRAKLFAPFDALAGLGEALEKQTQVLLPKPRLSESEQDALNRRLLRLEPGVRVTVRFFRPQTTVDGELVGDCVTVTGAVERLDALNHALHLDSFLIIPLGDLLALDWAATPPSG